MQNKIRKRGRECSILVSGIYRVYPGIQYPATQGYLGSSGFLGRGKKEGTKGGFFFFFFLLGKKLVQVATL